MRSLLVFPFRKFGFHEESLSLAEKTRFASPQRRMAANRYGQVFGKNAEHKEIRISFQISKINNQRKQVQHE